MDSKILLHKIALKAKYERGQFLMQAIDPMSLLPDPVKTANLRYLAHYLGLFVASFLGIHSRCLQCN